MEPKRNAQAAPLSAGLGVTLLIALLAKLLSQLPLLGMVGQLVLALLIGMLLRFAMSLPQVLSPGIDFATKRLLRVGIVLLGMRLQLVDLLHAGPSILLIAMLHVTITWGVVYGIARLLRVSKEISFLTASGTAICGAAAVVALSPLIQAKERDTALSASIAAVLGTAFTLLYVSLYPVLGLTPVKYGVLTGGTLHEVAHAVAAAAPGGQAAEDMSVLVKLSRVCMLLPLSIGTMLWMRRRSRTCTVMGSARAQTKLVIPWFIGGFFLMAVLSSAGWIPVQAAPIGVELAYFLMAMAMAGLGLKVDLAFFRHFGTKPLVAAFIGSILLACLGMLSAHYLWS